jgi:hypothetical protein
MCFCVHINDFCWISITITLVVLWISITITVAHSIMKLLDIRLLLVFVFVFPPICSCKHCRQVHLYFFWGFIDIWQIDILV